MELLLAIAISVVVGALIYFNREARNLDINQDGKVNIEDAKEAVKKTVRGVKKTADVNKDGKVNKTDAKVAATKVKAAVKAKTAKKPRSTPTRFTK